MALRLAWRAGRRELTLMLALQVVQVAGLVVQDVLDDALAEQHQQRLALARLFFRDAPFVILDEPTAALDANAEHALFASSRELLADRSVLLISHRLSSLREADRIYVLEDGEVVEHGAHEELMVLDGLYAEMFTLQAAAYRD